MLQQIFHLVLIREPPRSLLGEHRLVVQVDLEHSTGTFDQLGADPQRVANLVRQTGGPRKVVSSTAVFNSDSRHRVGLQASL